MPTKQLLVVEYKSLGTRHLHLVMNKTHLYEFRVFFLTPDTCVSFTYLPTFRLLVYAPRFPPSPTYLLTHTSTYLPIHISTYLLTHTSTYLPIHTSTYLLIYLGTKSSPRCWRHMMMRILQYIKWVAPSPFLPTYQTLQPHNCRKKCLNGSNQGITTKLHFFIVTL